LKRRHFERLKPACPQCNKGFPLAIHTVLREEPETILEGLLICSNPECLCEYPIIDGIPIIVANVRTYIAQNVQAIMSRTDLSDTMESLLGDCCGSEMYFNTQRQYLSTYAFDHYGDLDPQEQDKQLANPGSVLNLCQQGLETVRKHPVRGPVIDMGCSVGRTSFALAEALDQMVIGIDLNFEMLRLAHQVLHRGTVRYPRRRVGIVYDRREFPANFPHGDKVDFWACDAAALPFSGNMFAVATSFNVIDCVQSPYEHLKSLANILKPGGHAILSTPYDWSASATPVELWLGGHSQRSETRGSSEAMLASLLGGAHPQAIDHIEVVSEFKDLPWTVRMHDRSSVDYRVHMMVIRKSDTGAET